MDERLLFRNQEYAAHLHAGKETVGSDQLVKVRVVCKRKAPIADSYQRLNVITVEVVDLAEAGQHTYYQVGDRLDVRPQQIPGTWAQHCDAIPSWREAQARLAEAADTDDDDRRRDRDRIVALLPDVGFPQWFSQRTPDRAGWINFATLQQIVTELTRKEP